MPDFHLPLSMREAGWLLIVLREAKHAAASPDKRNAIWDLEKRLDWLLGTPQAAASPPEGNPP
jgi:hypothetical protein